MAIKLKKLKVTNKLEKGLSEGYYFKAIKSGTKTLDDVLRLSCKDSKWDWHDAMEVFELTIESIIEYLKDGYSVDLGPLGRFKATAQGGKMEENPDDLDPKDVKLSINYKISDTLKKAIAEAQIEIEEKDYDI